MDNKPQLDDIFKQARQRYDRTPSDKVWTQLEKRLDQRKPRRKPLSIWYQVLTVAAVLLLVLLPISYYIAVFNTDKQPIAASQTPDVDTAIALNKPTTDTSNSMSIYSKQQAAKGNEAIVAEATTPKTVDKRTSQPPTMPPPNTAGGATNMPQKSIAAPIEEQKGRVGAAPAPAQATTATKSETAAKTVPPAATTRAAAEATDAETSYRYEDISATKSKSRGAANAAKPTKQPSDNVTARLSLSSGYVMQYINALREAQSGVMQINNTPQGSLTADDVAILMPLLNSTEPAAAVIQHGQAIPQIFVQSTVGNEAYWIVKAYKDKKAYPQQKISVKIANNGAIQLYNTAKEIKALESWWQQQ